MSPRNNEQNQQIRDERREQILASAVKVFARRGLTGTKISDIAQATGLSHGLVYHYFESKDEIFTELVDRSFAGANEVLNRARRQPGNAMDQLTWMIDTILAEDNEETGHYYMLMLHAFTSDSVPPAVKERVSEQQVINLAEYVAPIIAAGQAQRLIVAGDPLRLAHALFAFLQGVILSHFQADRNEPKINAELMLRFLRM